VANDIRNGQMVTVIYDGSLFQMLSQTGNTQGATTTACTIGATGPGGGKIFYCGPPYNMESSTTDQNTGTATFGCSGIYISSFFELGTGMGNTANIAASCATAGIAAKICDVLVLGGKSDWFLPSKDELDLMYQYRTTIGNFSTSGIADYWSSSRNDLSNAWVRDFSNGAEGAEAKSSTNNRVRCIRSFQ
jgi:hypothetical protein